MIEPKPLKRITIENAPKDCCPMCGYKLSEIPEDQFHCPHCLYSNHVDQLISEWDDCAWDQ